MHNSILVLGPFFGAAVAAYLFGAGAETSVSVGLAVETALIVIGEVLR